MLPLAGGALTAMAFGLPLFWQGIFIGTILTATSVSISAQTLMELGALRSREGSTILAAAVIDDVMGIVVLSLVVALAGADAAGRMDGVALVLVVVRLLAFFAVAIAARGSCRRSARWARDLPVSQALLAAVLVIAFVYGWAAEDVGGVAAITGTYLAGVLVGQTEFKSTIDAGVHPLTYSMFVPVFFISIGLQADGRALGGQVAFTVVAGARGDRRQGGRLRGVRAVVGLRYARVDPRRGRDDLAGEVGLIVAGYGLTDGLIGRDVFSAAVLVGTRDDHGHAAAVAHGVHRPRGRPRAD